MNHQAIKLLRRALFPLTLLLMTGSWQANAQTETKHIIVESGDSALSKEAARQSKEQWDSTRTLRNKVNNRVEKEFDKTDRAIDLKEKCTTSANVNAYWEGNSNRCLDRRTGRQITP